MLGTKPVRSRPSEAATRSREFQVWWGCLNKSVFRNVPLSHKQTGLFGAAMSQVRPHASKTSDVLGATCNVFVLVPGSAVTAILRKLKQQSRESVEDKRPKLLKALREVRITLPHYTASQNVAVFSESPQAAICIALSLRTHQSSEILDVKPSRACTFLRPVNFYECLNRRVCLLCSLVTFIWSCTGIFRAGVSCQTRSCSRFCHRKENETRGWIYSHSFLDFTVPLLSRMLPSDACKIYKQGINIR